MMPPDQMKASLFNLVIYTHQQERTDYFMEIVHTIIERFPCRVIFIQTSVDSEFSTKEETIAHENSYIACDLITLNAPLKEINRIPYLVLQHLVPDLPVYLIWGQDPTAENPLYPLLLQFANRLVFDSECIPDLKRFARLMLAQIDSSHIDIMDVDWALISRWRHVLTQVFDNQNKIDLLHSADTVTITYNDRLNPYNRHNDTRAIYLQGWLAAQLDWNWHSIAHKAGDMHLVYQTPKGSISVILHPGTSDKLHPGSILEVKTASKNSGAIDVVRAQDQPKVSIHVSNHEQCDIPYNLPLFDPQKGLTFVKEMFFHPPSDHYRKMLELISQINWESA